MGINLRYEWVNLYWDRHLFATWKYESQACKNNFTYVKLLASHLAFYYSFKVKLRSLLGRFGITAHHPTGVDESKSGD